MRKESKNPTEVYNKLTKTDYTDPIEKGIKYDHGKPRYSLVPALAHQEIARVLTFGAQKYDDENWRKVEKLRTRYLDAAQRHIEAYKIARIGNTSELDEESELHHLAHAATCLMFILDDIELEKNQ